MSDIWGLHWFRRDLRVTGNEALRENWKRTQGKTLGLFCFDSHFLSRSDFSHHRFAFFLKTLKALKEEFQKMGGDLLVVDKLPLDFYEILIERLQNQKRPLPQCVSWNRDYEPFARKRDQDVSSFLSSKGVAVITQRDHLLFEPHEIKKEGSSPFYQIYSPFSRQWFEKLNSELGQTRIQYQDVAKKTFFHLSNPERIFRISWKEILPSHWQLPDQLNNFEKKNSEHVTIPLPEGGFREAYRKLTEFSDKLNAYKKDRDLPAISGTSKLSIFLKNGSLTTTQILNAFRLSPLKWELPSGPVQFVKELAWREFYYHILYHRPEVEKKSFNLEYETLTWENREDHFERWKEGTTGFPIVDAGMRELRQTGWMHNRVRMIVASFLTKDLLIDWRWGEHYFMNQLLDGDLAPNNGGWQWAASTGCDPQPYFRIFNPWLQSAKFDPEGTYIRKYIPELKTAPTPVLHTPDADRKAWKYPSPIVNHAAQKIKALKIYKKHGGHR